MAIYTEEFLEKINAISNIVEIIEFYLGLEKTSKSFLCACPFCYKIKDFEHEFVVSKIGKSYHCLKCGVNGDAIYFLMNFLNIEFRGAIKLLAKKYKVPIEYEKNKNSDSKIEEVKIHRNFIKESFSKEDRLKQEKIEQKIYSGAYSGKHDLALIQEWDAINKKYCNILNETL